jgi:ABC-type multidrug transport system ATPase subunit
VYTNEGPHAGQLMLLKGITGSFRPKVLTALMGASGAGEGSDSGWCCSIQ